MNNKTTSTATIPLAQALRMIKEEHVNVHFEKYTDWYAGNGKATNWDVFCVNYEPYMDVNHESYDGGAIKFECLLGGSWNNKPNIKIVVLPVTADNQVRLEHLAHYVSNL